MPIAAQPATDAPATNGRRLLFVSAGAILALLCAAAAGCQRAGRPNILLIVIDTLRADRLSAYGESRDLTPFLDSLAARGAIFQNTYAPSSWTNPSIASLFTSRYQSQHHIESFAAVLADDETTLAEVLREAGYATGAFSANYLIDAQHGYGQGFDTYRVFAEPDVDPDGRRRWGKARAERLQAESAVWLDRLTATKPAAPVFLYLHYMEPHNPYNPEAEHLDRVLAGRPAADRELINRRMLAANVGTFSDALLQGVKDYYDAEVMSLDAKLRELFDSLQRRGFLDNAVVVITADHGEELREHGHVGHGQTLFQEVIRVPLIVLAPRRHESRVVASLVSLLDVAPTLLELAGVGPAPPSFVGQSLAPLIAGADAGRDFAFSELLQDPSERLTPHERAVVGTAAKMITGAAGGRSFFDLGVDPGETIPDGLGAATRQQLAGELRSFVSRFATAEGAVAPTLSPETIERMRALGYHE